jgi:anti-sigma B factor antagonist
VPDRPFLPEPFRVETRHNGDTVRVRPVGELDLATSGELDDRLRELCEAGHDRIVLDLSGLSFMDSTGLRLMLSWDARSRSNGLEFVVAMPPDHVARVMALAGVRDRLRFE